jgi:hypothetical protein
MTIASIPENDRRERFIASAGQTSFPFDFPIYDQTDLQVLRERSGVVSTLTLGTDFTVTGAGDQAGGSITLTTGATAGDILVLLSAMPSGRSAQFVNGGDLPAAALEAEFNRLAILFQQNARDAQNSLLYPSTDGPMPTLPPIASRAGRFLAFDMLGQPYAAGAPGTALDAVARAGDTMTGPLRITPGSAAAPGLTPAGDANTGLFAPAADIIAMATNGVERARVTNNLFSLSVPINVPQINGGALAGMRNLIINGNPVINERVYVSGTPTSSPNQYTLDRWRVVTAGQAVSWTDSAGIRTVTAPAGGMEQVIEALNNLGGVHTISWTGSATATVNGTLVANGGQVTLAANTNVTIRLSDGTWACLQLEPGTVATPFERRHHGQERALCQRYFYMIPQGTYGFPCPNSGGFSAYQRYDFKVTMRVAPTITWLYGTTSNLTSIIPNTVNPDYATVQYVGTTSTNSTWVLLASPASAEL